jgi:CheY-like chemotaxis protein
MDPTRINLQGLTFLIADANSFVSSICQSILRGFGATRVIDVRNAGDAIKALELQKIAVLLCDVDLPPNGGFSLTRAIRQDTESSYRTIPILIMTSDTRTSVVAQSRDCGANMLIAKPMSAAALYDRLAWIASSRRKFVDAPTYFGPDRRFKIEGFPNGVGRRTGDGAIEVGEDSGPALAQSEIDSLFNAVRSA